MRKKTPSSELRSQKANYSFIKTRDGRQQVRSTRRFPFFGRFFKSEIDNCRRRRKIRLIKGQKGNAKCRHLKKLTYKGTVAGVYLSKAHNPPPLYTLYTCIQYTYSHRGRGRGGESEPERRLEEQ